MLRIVRITTSVVVLFTLALAGAASAAEPATKAPSSQEAVLELQVRGMVTKSCPVLVKAAVGRMAGVSEVDASLEKKSATVRFDPKVTSAREILRVIKDDVGFDAVPVVTARFAITGMVTKSCPVLVKAAVSKLKGVRSVDADLASKTATVVFIDGETSAAEIARVIKDDAGFDAALVQR